MQPQTGSHTGFCFDAFEVDVATEELRKHGIRIKLAGHPFRVLVCLLERSPELVTREELRQELWPADTFVDFDHGLGTAVNKLREALGDSAEHPRYIETIPRHGYRFIGAVEMYEPAAAIRRAASSVAPSASPAGKPQPPQSLPVRSRRSQWLLAWGVLALGATAAVYFGRPSAPRDLITTARITSDDRQKFGASAIPNPIVRDGDRLYFTEWSGTRTELAEVSDTGGQTRYIASPTPMARIEGTCGKSRLIVLGFRGTEAEANAYLVPVPAGDAQPLPIPEVHAASCSPDASRIAYARADRLAWTPADRQQENTLAILPGAAYWIRWSPDGKRLRFTLVDPVTAAATLWEVNADGRGLHPFAVSGPGHRESCCGHWTSDGNEFVFQDGNGEKELWSMLDHRWNWWSPPAPLRMTHGPFDTFAPLAEDNGSHLFAISGTRRGELMHYSIAGGRLEPYLGAISIADLDFSPDGKAMVYVRYPEGSGWRSMLDGNEKSLLIAPEVSVKSPRWSPDGRRIAFIGQVRGRKPLLYVADGNAPATPVVELQGQFGRLGWSPAGDRIVLSGEPGNPTGPAITIFDLRSGRFGEVPGSHGRFDAIWSPDGSVIAARSADAQQILLYGVAAGTWHELARVPAGWLHWSQDGRYVFTQTLGADAAWVRVRVSDGAVERLFPLSDVRQVFSAGGPWTGLAPDGAPLLVFDTGTEEIYSLSAQKK